jgi:trans-aconitate methyltransferase
MWGGLTRVRSDWNRHAETDPLWAVLTHPEKKNRLWDSAAFFETGQHEIDELMRYAGSLGVELARGRALDFGCGVGRLTRALAGHFDQVYGVDISPAMLELARKYNAHIPNCTFVENPDPSFRALPAGKFDLIYSNITLQHMPPRHAMRYLGGLADRLQTGGLLVFQLPSECRATFAGRLLSILYQEIYRRHVLRAATMGMYGVPKQRIIALLEQSGCRVLDVKPNETAGPDWTSYRYAAVREPDAHHLSI